MKHIENSDFQYDSFAFSKEKQLIEQSERKVHWMNSDAKQEFFYFQSFIIQWVVKDFRQMWIHLSNCGWNAIRINLCGVGGKKESCGLIRCLPGKVFGVDKQFCFKGIFIRSICFCRSQIIE